MLLVLSKTRSAICKQGYHRHYSALSNITSQYCEWTFEQRDLALQVSSKDFGKDYKKQNKNKKPTRVKKLFKENATLQNNAIHSWRTVAVLNRKYLHPVVYLQYEMLSFEKHFHVINLVLLNCLFSTKSP